MRQTRTEIDLAVHSMSIRMFQQLCLEIDKGNLKDKNDNLVTSQMLFQHPLFDSEDTYIDYFLDLYVVLTSPHLDSELWTIKEFSAIVRDFPAEERNKQLIIRQDIVAMSNLTVIQEIRQMQGDIHQKFQALVVAIVRFLVAFLTDMVEDHLELPSGSAGQGAQGAGSAGQQSSMPSAAAEFYSVIFPPMVGTSHRYGSNSKSCNHALASLSQDYDYKDMIKAAKDLGAYFFNHMKFIFDLVEDFSKNMDHDIDFEKKETQRITNDRSIRRMRSINDLPDMSNYDKNLPEEVLDAKIATNGVHVVRNQQTTQEIPTYYLLLDCSASTEGTVIDFIKGVALSIARKAHDNAKNCFVRFFNNQVFDLVSMGSSYIDFADYLASTMASGGTSIDNALSTAIEDYVNLVLDHPKLHVIVITDGTEDISEEYISSLPYADNLRMSSYQISDEAEYCTPLNGLRKLSKHYRIIDANRYEEALKSGISIIKDLEDDMLETDEEE